jgi:Cellulose binding domain
MPRSGQRAVAPARAPVGRRVCVVCLVALVLWVTLVETLWAEARDTVSVNYTVTSQWTTGFSGELTIKNNASRPITDWRFSFELVPRITRIWNATLLSCKESAYFIGPAGWDSGELASGTSIAIGFVATGSATAVPTHGSLNGAPIRFNESSPAPPARPASVVRAPAWPRTVFAPYVDATLWPQLNLITAAKELAVRRFRLGFVVAKSATEAVPTWGGVQSATSSFRLSEINSLRVQGGDVAIAFGGAVGVELAVAARSTADLIASYQSVIDTYDARVLDFDLEGISLTDRGSIQRRVEALSILQERSQTEQRPLEIWFTLPILPGGLSADAIHILHSAIEQGVRIRGVNGMTMDYGDAVAPSPTGRMGAYAVEAARNLHGQLLALYAASRTPKKASEVWQMIGVTPMIGRNDVAAEVFQQTDAGQVLEFAKTTRIGLLSIWSLNRDRSCEQLQASASPLCSGIPQRAYEFTRVFQPFEDWRGPEGARAPLIRAPSAQ